MFQNVPQLELSKETLPAVQRDVCGLVTLADDIRTAVSSESFYIGREAISRPMFSQLVHELGFPWRFSEIKIEPGSPWRAASGGELSLHTDNPHANLIAWFCHIPCPERSPTRVVNLRDITSRFDPETLKLLTEIRVPVPEFPGSNFGSEPLLTVKGGAVRLNFVDWFEPIVPSDGHAVALDRFRNFVQEKERNGVIAVSLDAGQFLILDNNSCLHGRDNLPATTPRNLHRFWINTEGRADLPKNF